MANQTLGLPLVITTGAIVADLVFGSKRGIGGVIPDCAIREQHQDDLEVTHHPVQRGSKISDNAINLPKVVFIEWGWSPSSYKNQLFDEGYLNKIYKNLLKLKEDRELISLSTGKRSYTNMLIRSLMETTEVKTENVLILRMRCEELILADLQTVTVPDASVQKNPSQNAAVINQGTKQLAPAPNFNSGG